MESRVQAELDSFPLTKPPSAIETMEHLALLRRWYYRGSPTGEIFLADDKNIFPMRRIVRGISRVLKGEKPEDAPWPQAPQLNLIQNKEGRNGD
jgi:hypothetical protein